MISKLILTVLIGASIGGIVGTVLKSAGGACPLTCNPVGGMITGAIIALLVFNIHYGNSEKTAFSPNVTEVVTSIQFDEIQKAGGIVLADFYATWCGPCRSLRPTINLLADRYAGKVRVVSVNVEDARELTGREGVQSIPDVRIYADGKEVKRFVGSQTSSVYEEVVEALLGRCEDVVGSMMNK